MRSCGDCTKCCEGYLTGSAKEKTFFKGKPCHFIEIGKGCMIYKDRPKDPCKSYQCMWVAGTELPEWMKPNKINAIVDMQKTAKGLVYLRLNEAGSRLDSRVLTWLIEYVLSNQINFFWNVDGGSHWLGSPDFCKEAELL